MVCEQWERAVATGRVRRAPSGRLVIVESKVGGRVKGRFLRECPYCERRLIRKWFGVEIDTFAGRAHRRVVTGEDDDA